MTETRHTLERVYREHGARLWRTLFAYTADREMSSDALAEAFAQALARGTAITDPASWIWTAAFRIAAGQLKARSRSGVGLPREPTYEMPDPVADVVAALSRLSPKQRMAIVLHDYADRPTDEVARVLGASRATVLVHLSQGRRRLRALMEDDDG